MLISSRQIAANLAIAGFTVYSLTLDTTIAYQDRMTIEFNMPGLDVDILITSINLSSYRLNLQHAC